MIELKTMESCSGHDEPCEKCATDPCKACITKRVIDFYKKGVADNLVEFCNSLAGLLSHANRMDNEDERQRIIMEDIMIEFDQIACKKENVRCVTDLFTGYDDDVVTKYQLGVIKSFGNYPKVFNSCNVIIEEGY